MLCQALPDDPLQLRGDGGIEATDRCRFGLAIRSMVSISPEPVNGNRPVAAVQDDAEGEQIASVSIGPGTVCSGLM